MFKHQGIAVESFVSFDAGCAITAQAFHDEIQVVFGHSAGSLNLFTDEAGLAMLATIITELLGRVQAVPHGKKIDIELPETPDAIARHQ